MKTENRPTITMKGMPNCIEVLEWSSSGLFVVRVWISSPTGDSSDSHTYDIPCVNMAQARIIAETWQKVWGLA